MKSIGMPPCTEFKLCLKYSLKRIFPTQYNVRKPWVAYNYLHSYHEYLCSGSLASLSTISVTPVLSWVSCKQPLYDKHHYKRLQFSDFKLTFTHFNHARMTRLNQIIARCYKMTCICVHQAMTTHIKYSAWLMAHLKPCLAALYMD